jgi:accessory colonization factor AcfC
MSDMKRIEPDRGANIVLNDGTSVDMKTLQGIYNEMTGRSEKIGKFFKDAHVIRFADVE